MKNNKTHKKKLSEEMKAKYAAFNRQIEDKFPEKIEEKSSWLKIVVSSIGITLIIYGSFFSIKSVAGGLILFLIGILFIK